MESKTEEMQVKTVEKALKILEVLAREEKPLTLTTIGKMSALNLSTAHRLLRTMCNQGFVEREISGGHYRLGLKALAVGNAALTEVVKDAVEKLKTEK